MSIKELLQQNTVCLDGGMGTLLQAAGLPLGELPERWNLTHAEVVQDIHKRYFEAGSHIVVTNTFGANTLKFTQSELDEIIHAAIENAKAAARQADAKQEKFIALDIGPLGKLLKPYGDFAFEEAVSVFAETVKLGVKYGADLIFIETMSDSYETKAALLATKENSDLPVFVSNAYGEDGKLMTGASPAAMVAMVEGMGADAIGCNCSLGPKQLCGVVRELLEKTSIPVFVKPNAGLPKSVNGETVYDLSAEEFAVQTAQFVEMGARGVGGCCGTTPEYICALHDKIERIAPQPILPKNISCVSSYTHAVEFISPVLIGERINPTGKKRFKQALLEKDFSYILNEGIAQEEKGAHILDVNVGIPDIDESVELPNYIERLQAVIALPLQIDTSNVAAMERAMRLYNGKPLVNSVNGKKESMAAVLPLVKKYGGMVVALTLDENGIPATAEGRVEIAERIFAEAQKYGITKKDILVDPLAMTISADKNAANITINAVKMLTERGFKTSLGVSNVSFGLPNREIINAAFFTRALENGLAAAILNPNSVDMMKSYYAFLALGARDENCERYIRFTTQELPQYAPTTCEATVASVMTGTGEESPLKTAIIKGMTEQSASACKTLLETKEALEIIDGEIVPALDEIGKAYEQKRAYLPQLLMSAEAAKTAFEQIKLYLLKTGGSREKKCKVVLATVKGDIHDIGKNIVKTLLENYGFDVVDLGKDVAPETIVDCAKKENAPIVGLSALMTTTAPYMQETIALLKTRLPQCKVMVGGAVITEDYAKKIGADGYGKDGMAAVRFVESVYEELK